ncbi:hypothetical protein ABL78_8401 [Leptomonas seymouri]|uniref:Uncharacterized protein n=1 Tax=Leptomonas seymouri TaxID=5684 RepID=A0A0N0P263_LEPSE|nr:hypothetical protein ABL78_8401 [Leptomonas seymouri]|eukprot:KPI82589.1 hypothetical protein ABL78_8401 [Leptomonas seymouri]
MECYRRVAAEGIGNARLVRLDDLSPADASEVLAAPKGLGLILLVQSPQARVLVLTQLFLKQLVVLQRRVAHDDDHRQAHRIHLGTHVQHALLFQRERVSGVLADCLQHLGPLAPQHIAPLLAFEKYSVVRVDEVVGVVGACLVQRPQLREGVVAQGGLDPLVPLRERVRHACAKDHAVARLLHVHVGDVLRLHTDGIGHAVNKGLAHLLLFVVPCVAPVRALEAAVLQRCTCRAGSSSTSAKLIFLVELPHVRVRVVTDAGVRLCLLRVAHRGRSCEGDAQLLRGGRHACYPHLLRFHAGQRTSGVVPEGTLQLVGVVVRHRPPRRTRESLRVARGHPRALRLVALPHLRIGVRRAALLNLLLLEPLAEHRILHSQALLSCGLGALHLDEARGQVQHVARVHAKSAGHIRRTRLHALWPVHPWEVLLHDAALHRGLVKCPDVRELIAS